MAAHNTGNAAHFAKMSEKKKIEYGSRCVQQLRSGVKRLFNELLLVPTSSTDSIDERVQTAHKNVVAIQRGMLELETLASCLESEKSSQPKLGNLGILSLDQQQDETDLHLRATKSFQDTKASHDIFTIMTNSIVRTDARSLPSLEPYAVEPPAKSCRALVSTEEVEAKCDEWNASHPKMRLAVCNVRSGVRFVKADVLNILTAYIQLDTDLLPQNVVAHGWKEFSKSTLSVEQEVCASSEFKVFQEVTMCCKLILLSLSATYRNDGQVVFGEFMEWLQCYTSLFNDICTVCKRQLTMGGTPEGPLPPCWRDSKSSSACHRSCRTPRSL